MIFYTIAIDVESVLKDNDVAREKITDDLVKIPLEDNGVDIGMARYVLAWNDSDKQQAILKEISRIIKNFAIIQHAGADNENPDDWRENMNKFLGGTTSKIKISGRFFSSGEEVERWMINNGINFERLMERKIEKVSNVFIEKMALNESEAQIAQDLLGDKDYIIQTTWLIFGQNRE